MEAQLPLKVVILVRHLRQAVDIQVLHPKEEDIQEVHHLKVGMQEPLVHQQVVILVAQEATGNHKLIQVLHNGLVRLTAIDLDR